MSLGLVASDLAASNARVAQTVVGTDARFGTLTAAQLLTDRVTVATLDTSVLTTTDLVAANVDLGTLTATDVQTDTETVDTLTATTVHATTVDATGTLLVPTLGVTAANGTTINATTVTVDDTVDANRLEAVVFRQTMLGSLRSTGEGKSSVDIYVAPIQLSVLNVDSNSPNFGTNATLYLSRSVNILSFAGQSASVTTPVAVTVTLVYAATPAGVATGSTVFLPQTVTNAAWSVTGNVTIPAGNYLSVRYTSGSTSFTTYNSWVIQYYAT